MVKELRKATGESSIIATGNDFKAVHMGFLDIFSKLASKSGKTVQGYTPSQRYRDYRQKGSGYSVESEISEKLAGLIMMLSTMPVSGDSERALWLDGLSDRFYQTQSVRALIAAFVTGDCLVVPSWNGRTIQNMIVDSENFEVLEAYGDEVTSCAYLVDTVEVASTTYRLMQVMTLERYEANDGTASHGCRYQMAIANDSGLTNLPLSKFPQWEAAYEADWIIPNVDRLLLGRIRTLTVDPTDFNSVKGAPICYGASDAIEEIHYLLEQMHTEFQLSEKIIMASKRMFEKRWGDRGSRLELPRGRERLYMALGNGGDGDSFHEWSPDIRYQAYLEALDKQEKLVERAVGVSSGILSTPNDVNYENVDNVRKSQQATMSFVNGMRGMVESCMDDLVYSWNVLANFYQVNAPGDYAVSFDWSDDYIETFGDRQNAILAGEAIGATDAVDYRQFVFDESPEVAKARVEEIKRAKSTADGSIVGFTIAE